MSELSTSSFCRLYASSQNRLRETLADTLTATIDDLQCKREDAIAQDLLDQIVVIAQGRDPAAGRLQDVCNFVLSLDYDDDEDDSESGGGTPVDTAPKTRDPKPGQY
jgi:hypothetical protein